MKERFPTVDSALCLRFLRARKGKVPDAIEMLRTHLQWRKDTFPISFESVKDQILKQKFLLRGRDLDGTLIIYIMGRNLGPDTYDSLENHMHSVFYLLEFVFEELLEDPMDKFTIIYNRVGNENTLGDNDWVKAIAGALQHQYPERMKRCLVYPTDRVFRWIWKIVKVFFDPVTADKIAFVGNEKELQKYVSPDQLLREVGGTDDFVFDIEHLENRGMISEEMRNLKRVAPKAMTVYDFD